MNILALDTSTKAGSIAITEDDIVLAESVLNINVTHSETLLRSLRDMLDESGTSLEEIDLLALTLGPGSFTGIRIGVGTMKGLSLALKIPVVGVSTLEALASNFPYSGFRVAPVIDARRGEVYTADFIWDNDSLTRLSEDRAVSPDLMLKDIDERTIFVGDGINKYGPIIRERLGEMALFAPSVYCCIRGSIVACIALKRFHEGDTLDINSFTPAYLRRSEAEIKRKKGLLRNC